MYVHGFRHLAPALSEIVIDLSESLFYYVWVFKVQIDGRATVTTTTLNFDLSF